MFGKFYPDDSIPRSPRVEQQRPEDQVAKGRFYRALDCKFNSKKTCMKTRGIRL